METLGARLQLYVSGLLVGGGDPTPDPDLDLCPLPFFWVTPPAAGFTLLRPLRSAPFALLTASHTVHLVMTHYALGAKAPCVSAVAGLLRALRSRLKALRRLLLLGERTGCDSGHSGLLNCCGPTNTSLAVSPGVCVCVFFCCGCLIGASQSAPPGFCVIILIGTINSARLVGSFM